MKLIIDSKIFEQNRDLKIGAIILKGINNNRRVSAVESLVRGACAQRSKEFAEQDIYEHPMIQCWSQAYGNFGINPKKYPPSIAALLKRLKAGKDLPHINLLVDLYNYFSLKYLLPIGGEDLDWLCGDLRLTFTKGGEPFRPIGSIDVERAAEGEAAYIDNGGITSRYWNYRECERSKFTNKTVNAVILIEDLSKMHMDNFGSILREIQNVLIKYIGGQIEPYILNEENQSIDLGIQGRKQADDAKVPQQEIAHYLDRARAAQKKAEVETQEVKESKIEIPAASETPKKKSIALSKPTSSETTSKELQVDGKDLIKSKVVKVLKQALNKTFPELSNSKDFSVDVEYPGTEAHGDYASNLAMHLGKITKTNPREVAEKIIQNLPKNSIIEKVEIAGPGFINFFLAEKAVQLEITSILKQKDKYGTSSVGIGETVIVEYSQPNIAKPLGVHHLLSTIIGQSLYNIFESLGFKTVGINYIGDWGTQFGKLICAYKKWGNKEVVESNPIAELLKLYVQFHQESEKNPALDDEARLEFKNFENGDAENKKLWQWFVDESMKETQRTYDKLGGIHFDYTQGESFYADKTGDILKEGKDKGIFVVGEEGAYVIHYEDENIPTLPIQKKDGATLYITRDFAALLYRIKHWNPVKIIYVVDVAQSTHFRQLFTGARMLGWYNGEAEHVSFGRMQFKDAKMSTRKGNIILLDEVLDEAVARTRAMIEEKNPDLYDKEHVARVIGIGAVKYNILSQNRTTDLVFDWDKMLSLEGNSAPYLQYSYARAKSILRKSLEKPGKQLEQMTIDESIAVVENGKDNAESKENSAEKIAANLEKLEKLTSALTHLLSKYREYIANAGKEYKPNILSNYLYNLSQKFNAFYNGVPVLKNEDPKKKKELLKIVEATAQILKNGLNLLGVEVVEEM